MTTEQRLWQAVLHRAFLDATADDPARDEDRWAKRDAHAWITDCRRDFRQVCGMAGMDADFLSAACRDGRVNTRLLRGMEGGVK